MPISDEKAISLLKQELVFYNETRRANWQLEPIKIEKQSDYFWQIWSNSGSEDSIELLLDAEKGRVLKNNQEGKYDKNGYKTVYVQPNR